MLLNCGVGEDSWKSLGLQGDPTSTSWRKSVLNIHWKDWCWSWNSNTLATWCEELTLLKRPWCWERLDMEGEGDDRGWDGWMASLTQWIWVWVNSRSWWWTGRPGVLQSVGSQRVGHNWATELNQPLCNTNYLECLPWILLSQAFFQFSHFIPDFYTEKLPEKSLDYLTINTFYQVKLKEPRCRCRGQTSIFFPWPFLGKERVWRTEKIALRRIYYHV